MPFSDFLGNTAIVDSIRRQLARGRLPQSLLFSGTRGIGKWTLAQGIAQAVNCARNSHDFCDDCSSCRRIVGGVYPDVKNIEPEEQFIVIDQIRDVSREVFFRPFEGKRRVFIIDQAEKMNAPAANAFLKTLEEPPETSILILVTSRPNDLLPTIRSRCQTYRFAPLPPKAIEKLLERRVSFAPEERSLLARIAAGSLGEALTLDLAQYRLHRQEMLGLLEACSGNFLYAHGAQAAAPWLDKRNKAYFDEKLSILFSLIRDLFLLKLDPAAPNVTHVDIQSKMVSLASRLSTEQLGNAARALDHIQTGARRNLNRGLAVDVLLLQLGRTASAP